jgi:simple sugar transport system ATP-binding protein
LTASVSPRIASASEPVSSPEAPVLSVRGLTKRFADVVAANALDLDFYKGEVHAILGENGAGKSTLVKMLYGFYRPDQGEMILSGEPVDFRSPADARRRGIGMVFQNFTLIPALTVLENIALVTQSSGFRLDASALAKRIRELSAQYGLEVKPSAYVRDLSIGEQQRVEILKALACDPSILILDEPTSVLAPHEVESLLEIVHRLREDGFSVILITHKLGEVFACATRVSVLRRGTLAGTGLLKDYGQRSLLTLMLGERAAEDTDPETHGGPAFSEEGFALRGVSFKAEDGRVTLHDVSIEIRVGEMVGIAAVSGNGQASLGDAFLGTGSVIQGSVHVGGRDVTRDGVESRLAAGLAIIPEDPLRDGAVPEMMVRENLNISSGPGSLRRWLMRPGEIIKRALSAAERSPFPLPSLTRRLGTLSGGNIQRVVLARELNEYCKYLLAYYPTRGLDLTSTRAVRRRLLDLKDAGRSVLLVSEDLDELRALCDRIVVLHEGAIQGTFLRAEADLMEIGRLMTGGRD